MWQSLLSSILGSAMNKQNPKLDDVKKKDSVLSQSSNLPNTSGGSGGFASALMGMAGGKEKGGETSDNGWILNKDNMWVRK